MRNEILTGIFGGLFCIAIFVSIGSFIGQASSHGPKNSPKAPKTIEQRETDAGKSNQGGTTAAPKPATKTPLTPPNMDGPDKDKTAEGPEKNPPETGEKNTPTTAP